MKLIELSSTEKKSYNQFVMNQPTGSFLQSWEWGQWQESLGHQIKRFLIKDLGENTVGSIQLILTLLPFNNSYVYIPYGPVGDINFKIEDFGFILQELKKRFSGEVFIRIEPKMNLALIPGPLLLTKTTNIQPGKTLVIDLQKSEEQLLAEMHPKTRYNIKLAQKHGVEILDEFAISPGHGLFFKEALELMARTAKRQGFVSFSESYYHKLIDALGLNSDSELKLHIYKAVFEKQLLASAIMADFGGTRTFLFGGSAPERRDVMAPYLLHFRAIQDAKAAGKNSYDFWGIETSGGQAPGFVRFKLGFGGSQKLYAGAYDYIVRTSKYKFYNLARTVNRLAKRLWL